MRKDPTEFRKRFAAWKAGEKVYAGGLPSYEDGIEDEKLIADEISANKGYTDAKQFVEQYSKSQGFKQRFYAGEWAKGFRNSKYDPAGSGKYMWNFTPKRLRIKPLPTRGSDGPKYNYDFRDVEYQPMSVPLKQDGKVVANSYDEIFSHELGHALDSAVHRYLINNNKSGVQFKDRDVWNGYSRSIPILRQNNLYQNIIKQRKPSSEKYIGAFTKYEQDHDALPEENYADLIQMRYLANKYGVFDSLKANNKFTKKHLDEYKKLNVPTRFLKNFSDDQIIWMMNNVANTNTHTDNEV